MPLGSGAGAAVLLLANYNVAEPTGDGVVYTRVMCVCADDGKIEMGFIGFASGQQNIRRANIFAWTR